MRRLLLIPLLFLFPSCGALAQLSKASGDISTATQQNQVAASDMIGKIGSMFGELKGTLDLLRSLDLQKTLLMLSQLPQMQADLKQAQVEMKAVNPQAFAQADKDKDGKLSPAEMIAYLLTAGGAGATVIAKLLAGVNARNAANAAQIAATAAAGDAKQQAEIDGHYDEIAELKKQLVLLMASQAPKA